MSWAFVLWSFSALFASASADAQPLEIDVADVSNAPDGCPTQDQLAEALEARMPGVVARGPREPSPNLLRLRLAQSPEGVARVTMTDGTGTLRLERDLDLPKSGAAPAGPARDRASGCAALAETVALIVERYMRHVGYREPPPPDLVAPRPPPPPPVPPPRPGGRGRLGVGVAARPPYGASWRVEPQLIAALRLRHVEVAALVAVALPEDEGVPMSSGQGTLRLRVFPARVSIGWILPLGRRLTLIPALGGGADVVLAETRGIDKTRHSTAVEPTVEAGVRAVAALTRRVWIELEAFQGVDIRPEQFTVMGTTGPETVFMTPRSYTRVGVDFGVFLGKN